MRMQMNLNNIISLLGGVALFLFGMTLMGDGLKKVAGSKLELVLYRLSGTPLRGVLLGTGVTAVIQSSSATSLMVVGFVNSGMMKLRQAIAVILGALLGTSVTGWIICLSEREGSGWVALFSTSTLSAVIAVCGIILRMFSRSQQRRHVGDIMLGFSVLMFGMQSMSTAVSPLRESAAFVRLITSFSNPLLGILAGALFTCILQSASAAVGILQALSVTGAVSFAAAYPVILGIAIGAGADIALEAADIVLMHSALSDVPAAIRLGRATLRNIKENLFWAFFYNCIGIPLAAGVFISALGWKLNPMFGAAAMSLSSFCVVTNALRLNFFDMYSSKHDVKKRHKAVKQEEKAMTKTLKIEGMMCGHCEARVKKTLEAIDGVESVEVSHVSGTAVVTLSKDVADDVMKSAVEAQDYKVLGIE